MVTTRAETVADYSAIMELTARAFGQRISESVLVALLRQRSTFDPALSLVAEVDGRVVGHALFSPYQMRMLGQTIPVVNLAPLAVEPAYQRQGIGGRLLAAGHAIAAQKGYCMSILLGHHTYYPRFGYRTHAYGFTRTEIHVAALPEYLLERHVPVDEDIPALQALWQRDEAEVDFALDPGVTLTDWLSPHPSVQATVYRRNGEIVGYTRINKETPAEPLVFLAHDAGVATVMAQMLAQDAHTQTLQLPVHPAALSASAFSPLRCTSSEAAMAIALAPSPLDEYMAQVSAGERPPGRPTWHCAFDIP